MGHIDYVKDLRSRGMSGKPNACKVFEENKVLKQSGQMSKFIVIDEDEVVLPNREIKWISRKVSLPKEVKMYGVRLSNGCYATDLRTPSKRELEDRSYEWFHYLTTHWTELPNPYFPYGRGEDGWFRYDIHKPPVDSKRYYFITTKKGIVDIATYCPDTDKFINTNDIDVIAWMPMQTVEEQYREIENGEQE